MSLIFRFGNLGFSVIFDLWFECRTKNEGEVTAFFSSNFAWQITLGMGPGWWTVCYGKRKHFGIICSRRTW